MSYALFTIITAGCEAVYIYSCFTHAFSLCFFSDLFRPAGKCRGRRCGGSPVAGGQDQFEDHRFSCGVSFCLWNNSLCFMEKMAGRRYPKNPWQCGRRIDDASFYGADPLL